MAVLIWLGGQGSVYEPSCPCILCPPLSPSPPNAWVMAYLCTIIRRTHTNTHSKKKKKAIKIRTHKTGAHTRLEATLTQLQSLFTGGGPGWGGGEGVRKKKKKKRQAEILHLRGGCVRRPCVRNKFSKAIDPTYGRLSFLCSRFTRFECNLLPSAPMSNFNHNIVFGVLFFFLSYLLLSSAVARRSDSARTAKPFSQQQNNP